MKRLANSVLRFAITSHLIIILYSVQVYASVGGVSRQSAIGCGPGGCHGPKANLETSLRIDEAVNNKLTFEPGETKRLTFVVNNANRVAVGCDIAVKTTKGGLISAGVLKPIEGQGLRLVTNELTQNLSPKSLEAGEVRFEFEWTAPLTSGTYFLQASANAVNMNGVADVNDQWNIMSAVEVTVSPASSVFEYASKSEPHIKPIPAHDRVTIHAEIKSGGPVDLTIFDLSGSVSKGVTIEPSNGVVEFTWDGTDKDGNHVPPGTYPFNIVAPNAVIRGIILFER